MKKHIISAAIVALGMAVGVEAMAVPAKPGVRPVSMADGTTVNVELVGDEFFAQYFTEDGYPLTVVDGNFYYCDITPDGVVKNSGIKAVDASKRQADAKAFLNKVDRNGLGHRVQALADRTPRRQVVDMTNLSPQNAPARAAGNDGPPFPKGPGLFPDLRFPAYGEQKAIVILVEYKDVKFTLSDPHDYFTRMLNEEGFNLYKGTGSCRDFFIENSNGAFVPEFDLYGPVTLSKNRAYYGAQQGTTHDVRPAHMIVEACQLLDDEVDFSQYDRNGDGIIDNVYVFYAGMGQANGGSEETIWPHSWNVEYGGFPNIVLDGKKLRTYGCSNEWEPGNRPDGIGTFVHEFSHVMGLPDLYATSYTGAFTPGRWSAMDQGPYNNNGCTPPNYGAFERYALGWMAPRKIDSPVHATLPPIGENVAGIVETGDPNEFFLVENRQQTGWDKYIPGHGMLVWHVDYDASIWRSNIVNNSATHQYVDIEEADGTQTEGSRAGDSFPGTMNKTEFGPATRPAMMTWDRVKIEYPLTEIAENNGIITFTVLDGGPGVTATTSKEPTDITPDGFTARWNASPEGLDVLLSVYSIDPYAEMAGASGSVAEEKRLYLPGLKDYNAGKAEEFVITNADPEVTYYYVVKTFNGWESSEESAEQSATTLRRNLDYYPVEALEATDVESTGFTANWAELNEAEAYRLSVYTKEAKGEYTDVNGFDRGLRLPEGWTTTAMAIYDTESYSGAATPALQMGEEGMELVSPYYTDDIKGLSFWCRGALTTSAAAVEVYIELGGEWQLFSSEPVTRKAQTVTVQGFPERVGRVKLVFRRAEDKGLLALDDVTLVLTESEPVMLEKYNDTDFGNVLSLKVSDLQPATRYYYKVRATGGEYISKYSKEIAVTTPPSSGIAEIEAACGISLAGRSLNVRESDVSVYDVTGCLVARGSGSFELPAAGVYMIRNNRSGKTFKVIVK